MLCINAQLGSPSSNATLNISSKNPKHILPTITYTLVLHLISFKGYIWCIAPKSAKHKNKRNEKNIKNKINNLKTENTRSFLQETLSGNEVGSVSPKQKSFKVLNEEDVCHLMNGNQCDETCT